MLLVGGDSFAQFPKSCYLEKDNQIEHGDPGLYPDYHWCQSLYAEAKSVGMGSADISSTTFITISEIIKSKNAYTHCVFFITHPVRTILNKEPQQENETAHGLSALVPTMEERYHSPEHTIPYGTASSYAVSDSNAMFMQASHATEEWQTNTIKSTHVPMAIHNKISNLLALKYVCDSNNIKLLFVAPFGPDPVNESINKFYKLDVFDYMTPIFGSFEQYVENNNKQISHHRTHHTTSEHDSILTEFNKQFPEWIT